MSDTPVAIFTRLEAVGLRRLAAVYLLTFLIAVAITPHQHLNSMEDLLSDEASDSGIFLERGRSPDSRGGPQWSTTRFRDDHACLACFHHDFSSAAEAIAFLVLAPRFSPISLTPLVHAPASPAAQTRSSRSRAPPALA